MQEAAPPWTVPDAAALREAFEQTGSSFEPPAIDWEDYAKMAVQVIFEAFAETARPVFEVLGIDPIWFVRGTLALMGVFVLWLAFRLVRDAVRGKSNLPSKIAAAIPQPAPKSGAARKAEAQAFLDRGDAQGALTSLWWWFAESVLRESPPRTMTTREVLVRGRRTDLRDQALDLDRLRFRSEGATEGEVRRLIAALETAL